MVRIFNVEPLDLYGAHMIVNGFASQFEEVSEHVFSLGVFSSFDKWDGAAICDRPALPTWDRPDTVELVNFAADAEDAAQALLSELLFHMTDATHYRRLILPPLKLRVVDIMRCYSWHLAGSIHACSRKARRNGRTHGSDCLRRFLWQAPPD